jgi:hypothetical protein
MDSNNKLSYYQLNKDKFKQYYENNREKLKERCLKYYYEHRVERMIYNQHYYAENCHKIWEKRRYKQYPLNEFKRNHYQKHQHTKTQQVNECKIVDEIIVKF